MLPSGRSFESFSTGWKIHISTRIGKLQWNETYICTRDTQEANRHEHTSDGNLVVPKLDAVKVLYTETVCCDKTVQCQDLVHLNRCDERATALTDNMRDWWRLVSPQAEKDNYPKHLLALTFDSFEVNGAAHEASPSLIFGTSSSASISASLSVIEARSN